MACKRQVPLRMETARCQMQPQVSRQYCLSRYIVAMTGRCADCALCTSGSSLAGFVCTERLKINLDKASDTPSPKAGMDTLASQLQASWQLAACKGQPGNILCAVQRVIVIATSSKMYRRQWRPEWTSRSCSHSCKRQRRKKLSGWIQKSCQVLPFRLPALLDRCIIVQAVFASTWLTLASFAV